jgi:hypothetical protein
MLIQHKRPFIVSLFLGISFIGVFLLIFSPIYGKGMNGLDYADDLFNKLSKGSSYFIPRLMEENKRFQGKPFSVAFKTEMPKEAEQISRLFTAAGGKVEVRDSQIKIEGDMGETAALILKDSDLMFHNQGKEVAAVYGFESKEVMKSWWLALSKMEKVFKKKLKVEEANYVSEISKKAIEPAYNYYGVEPHRVIDRAGIMIFLLGFYVFYTLWWGYAIFYLFEGVGLTMKKAKIKKEV